jgi:hypothetical protein
MWWRPTSRVEPLQLPLPRIFWQFRGKQVIGSGNRCDRVSRWLDRYLPEAIGILSDSILWLGKEVLY